MRCSPSSADDLGQSQTIIKPQVYPDDGYLRALEIALGAGKAIADQSPSPDSAPTEAKSFPRAAPEITSSFVFVLLFEDAVQCPLV
jgi:hypothetical protein